MNIELSELATLLRGGTVITQPCDSHPWKIGANYFIRTVTHHFTGRLDAVYPTEIVLLNTAWIADDGRFSDALKSGEFNEVEPYPGTGRVIIGRASLIDACELTTPLPVSQK